DPARARGRVALRLRPLPVAPARRAIPMDRACRAPEPALRRDRGLLAELRGRVRPHARRLRPDAKARARPRVRALVATAHGVYTVDLDTEEVEGLEEEARLGESEPVSTGLPRVVAAAASGSTVIAVVETRPPLAVSHDA